MLATFLHTYSAAPSGALRCISVAVISSQTSEHSMSTTMAPFAPEEVPVTLITAMIGRVVDYVEGKDSDGDVQWTSEIVSSLGNSAQVVASVS